MSTPLQGKLRQARSRLSPEEITELKAAVAAEGGAVAFAGMVMRELSAHCGLGDADAAGVVAAFSASAESGVSRGRIDSLMNLGPLGRHALAARSGAARRPA